ncbi:hypothetical protein [Streptomyces sp. 900105245]
MSKESSGAVDAGVFVASLVLLVVSILKEWPVLPWIFGAILLGVLVTAGARKQAGQRSAQDDERPWRKRAN